MPVDPFTWNDGERVVRFGRGTIVDAPSLLGDGYTLLTTERAAASAPEVVARAARVLDVPLGDVGSLAAGLLEEAAGSDLLVALGGGRVIDTAKALAALQGGRVAAIPTTLSAAEMTSHHRLPQDAPAGTPQVRPHIVLNDPGLSASQPDAELAASAANSLGHAVEGALTRDASPVPSLAGREAIRLTQEAYADATDPGRDELALAALLSGYAIDQNGYGLHHVLSQTLRAIGGVGHGQANAVMLPHTARALAARFPGRVPDVAITLAEELARLAGAQRLRDLAVTPDTLDRCATAAARRADLDHTPPKADEAELRSLYDAAW
jgi:alcohol dehydrogenase class IV